MNNQISSSNDSNPSADGSNNVPLSNVTDNNTLEANIILPDVNNAAANLIRQKLDNIYANEPDVQKEMEETEQIKTRSKHQEFIYKLLNSGKNLATVQTDWHNYYVSLDDKDKYQVWQEFYESNTQASHYNRFVDNQTKTTDRQGANKKPYQSLRQIPELVHRKLDNRSRKDIQQSIINRVNAGGKLKVKHHFQSLLFGLGIGSLVIFIFLFGFFNEFFIAPFIQPSRQASAIPIIINPNTVAPTSTPEIIIPKINVEIAIDYSQNSTNEADIENALENGIVHYPTTVLPGEVGNAAFFGHSSNNIFNKGKYKFAFVLLHELVPGDTFYITKDSKVYVYKVITRTIVDPNDVAVLNNIPGQVATATLITCDPPGTSLHRLIVVGQQVSPDPTTNSQSTAPSRLIAPTYLPGNGPSLLSRLIHWIF